MIKSRIAKSKRNSEFHILSIQGDKNDGCSFIERALNDREISSFRVLDVNSDGFDDVIYSGSAQCAEGNATLIWLGSDSGYSVAKSGLWHGLALKILQSKMPRFSFATVGCCGDLIDEYYLGSMDSFKRIGAISTTEITKQPHRALMKSVSLRNHPPQFTGY